MLTPLAKLAERIAAHSARPDSTVLALSYLISGAVVLAMRALFGEAG
jgi:hypothetical protein